MKIQRMPDGNLKIGRWIFRLKKSTCPEGWFQPFRTKVPMVPERNPLTIAIDSR